MNINRANRIRAGLGLPALAGVPQPLDGAQVIPARQTVQRRFPPPIPDKDWPMWAKALKLLAKPEDKGIGDVIARTIGAEKSQAFKTWYKATFGKDCGCSGRQSYLNIVYPLQPAGSQPAEPLQRP